MKKWTKTIALMAAVMMLTGCVGIAALAEDPVVVRILTRYSNPDNVREKYFIDRVAQFREENPDIDLQDMSISDENSRDTKFKTAVSAGNPIEVFNFLGYAANVEYVEGGVITNLADEIAADSEWTAKYNQALFAPVDYSAYGVEGLYGLPTTPYGVCTYYNKAIFDKLGLEVPETWEDIEACAPTLIENGITPMAFGAKDNYRGGHFLTALSMKVYNDDLKNQLISGEEKWNGEKVVGLIQKMQDWYEAGIFGSNNLAYNADGELAKLESGEVAIAFSGSWTISTVATFANAADIVCKGFPYFASIPEYKDMWMGGPDDFMSISSKPGDADYEATMRVLKYFTSQEYWEGLYAAQEGAGTYPVAIEQTIESDHLTTQFNDYYSVAPNMIGEIEQFDTMASLMDIVRTELQTLFAGDTAQEIGDRIQEEVDAFKQ